jgi:small subunit ribosomal protein S16
MLKIRLQRVGKKHDPSFRVVVTEHTSGPNAGKNVEVVGYYDARKGKGSVQLNGERIQYWVNKGAKTSDTVHNLLVSKGVIEGKKRDVLPRKKIAEIEAKKEEEQKSKEAEEKVNEQEEDTKEEVEEIEEKAA